MEVNLICLSHVAGLRSSSPEQLIVEMARVSSSREDKTAQPEGLIRYLIKNKHWSPFEMVSMTVEIVTSRAISQQIIRHRSFSYQEFSQRYAEVSTVEPIELRKQAETNRQSSTDIIPDGIVYDNVSDAIRTAQDCYKHLIDAGVAKECARMILPMASQTRLYMAGTIRSWIHYLELRTDPHTQKEHRLIAEDIKGIFCDNFPLVSQALGWKHESH